MLPVQQEPGSDYEEDIPYTKHSPGSEHESESEWLPDPEDYVAS